MYEVGFQSKYSGAYRRSGIFSEHLPGYFLEYLNRSPPGLIDALVFFHSIYRGICGSI